MWALTECLASPSWICRQVFSQQRLLNPLEHYHTLDTIEGEVEQTVYVLRSTVYMRSTIDIHILAG